MTAFGVTLCLLASSLLTFTRAESTTVSAAASAETNLAACAASMNGLLPSPTPSNFYFSGNVRKYYVAAEEVNWDYAPTGWDNYMGVPLNLSPRAKAAGYTERTKWEKALYRGYTDATFSEYSAQPAWQGSQGPTLRSEVGDLVEIMFVNKLSENYASMHSMGLEYTKGSEGSDYPNNTAPGQEPPFDPRQAVQPGGCVVYKWMVDEASAPYDGEPSKAHSYHSYVAMQQDINAGLIGPQIVYARGQMNATMSQYREFPLLYMIYSESESFMSKINNANGNSGQGQGGYGSYGGYGAMSFSDSLDGQFSGNYSIWHPQLVNLLSAFQGKGPSFYSLNGWVLSNNPVFPMCRDDNVIWYVYAYGSASHVFHMHGNNFYYNNDPLPSISINVGEHRTLFMNATGVGLWEVICHVAYHNTLGMIANYRVYQDGCPLPPPAQANVPSGAVPSPTSGAAATSAATSNSSGASVTGNPVVTQADFSRGAQSSSGLAFPTGGAPNQGQPSDRGQQGSDHGFSTFRA